MKERRLFKKYTTPNMSLKFIRDENKKQIFFQDLIDHLQKQLTSQQQQFFRISILISKNKDKNSIFPQQYRFYQEENTKQGGYSPLHYINQDIFKHQKNEKTQINLHQVSTLRNSEPCKNYSMDKHKKQLNLRCILNKNIEKQNINMQNLNNLNKTCNINRKKKFIHITSNEMQLRQKQETLKILRFNKAKKVYRNSFLSNIFDKTKSNVTLINLHQDKQTQLKSGNQQFTDRLLNNNLDKKYQMISSCKINKSPKNSPRKYNYICKFISRKY